MQTNLDLLNKLERGGDCTIEELTEYAGWAQAQSRRGVAADAARTIQNYRRRHIDAADAIVSGAEGEQRGLLASEQRAADKQLGLAGELQTLIEQLDQRARLDGPTNVAPDVVRPLDAGDRPIDPRVGGTRQRGTAFGQRAAEFMAECRAMGSSTLAGGGAIVPSGLAGEIISQLVADSVALRAGIRLIETPFDVLHLPRTVTDPTAIWLAENAEITASDATLAEIVATAHKLAALTVVSNELAADSNPAVAELLFNRMTRSLSLALDLAIFEGTGFSNQIKGLRDRSGISSASMGTNGAAFTNLDPFADALGTLAASNAKATAIVMHPRSWKSLIKLKEDTAASRNKALLQNSSGSGGQAPSGEIYGVPVFLSSQLSITETQGSSSVASSAYVFQADQVALVRHRDIRVEVDRSRYFEKDQTAFRAITHVDVAVLNEPAVYRIKGIIE